ncbi:MAG: cyclase family protein [Gammaproteobacteria bacterium]
MMRQLIIAVTILLTATITHAEEKWWPSKWGADDTIGAFNQLGPELTLKAASLIKTGKTYKLGIETNSKTPGYAPRTFEVSVVYPNQYNGTTLGANQFSYFDDMMNGWMGVGSQIDGLGHAGTDGVFYNGLKGKDFAKIDGLKKMGVEDYPPIVSRGILLDMAKCMGQAMLKEGTPFTRENIMACEKQQGTFVEKGDVVLFHSGWMGMMATEPEKFVKVQPGLGVSGAEYLAEKDVIAVGADTTALEVIPFEDPEIKFRVHQILLNYNGIYILENMDTRELAADNGYEFMFVLGPARITGAVQMIINPIAIR